jgi:hypothetical protein
MRGAIPPLPHYAFMAWRSVKAQGEIYLYPKYCRDWKVYPMLYIAVTPLEKFLVKICVKFRV